MKDAEEGAAERTRDGVADTLGRAPLVERRLLNGTDRADVFVDR
jgi:hypothetical protein